MPVRTVDPGQGDDVRRQTEHGTGTLGRTDAVAPATTGVVDRVGGVSA